MRAARGIRQDPRAAAVARLRSLRNNDPAYVDLSQLTQPSESSTDNILEKVKAVNKAAKSMKVAINDRDDKLKWHEEYNILRHEEQYLTEEIEKWIEIHKDWSIIIPKDIDNTTINMGNPNEVSPLESEAESLITVQDMFNETMENKYTLSLQKQTLQNHLSTIHKLLDSCKQKQGKNLNYTKIQSQLQNTIIIFDNLGKELSQEYETIQQSIRNINSKNTKDDAYQNMDNNDTDTKNINTSSPSSSKYPRSPSSSSSPNTTTTTTLYNRCTQELNLIGGSNCEDTMVYSQVVQGLITLYSQYDKDIQVINNEWENICTLCQTTSTQEFGGWTHDAHLAYKQALQLGKSTSGAGKTRISRFLQHKQQLARIREQNNQLLPNNQDNNSIEPNKETIPDTTNNDDEAENNPLISSSIPASGVPSNTLIESNEEFYDMIILLVQEITHNQISLSRDKVEKHHRWATEHKHYKQRKTARDAQFTREHKDYMDKARRAFEKAAVLAETLRIRAQTLAEHEKIRQETHQRLEVLKARKAVEDAIAANIAAEMAEAENAVKELDTLARKERAKKMKKALEKYYQDQAAIEARIDEIKQQQALADIERKKEQLASGLERIEYRAKLLETKQEQAKQLIKEAEELEQQKQLLLEKLIKNVDYYERIEEIANTTDKERITAHTVASKTSTELSLAYAYYIKTIQNNNNNLEDNVLNKISSHDTMDLAIAAKYAPDRPDHLNGMTNPGTDESMHNPSKSTLLSLANQRIKEKGLFGKFGYSEKQITSDKRWRFVSSAWAAGIQGTHTARDALQQIKPVGRGVLQVNQAMSSQITW